LRIGGHRDRGGVRNRLLRDGSGGRRCRGSGGSYNEIWKLIEVSPERREILLPMLAAAEILVNQAPEGL